MATILIVDDSPLSRLFLVDLLSNAHHRLLEATDGVEALGLVRAERPDLVITDILMPTMDGYEFVRRLRSDPAIATTPVIFYSSHYHEQAAALARSYGVGSDFHQACEPDVVLRAVNAAFGLTPSPSATPEVFSQGICGTPDRETRKKPDKLNRANERLNELIELWLLGSNGGHPAFTATFLSCGPRNHRRSLCHNRHRQRRRCGTPLLPHQRHGLRNGRSPRRSGSKTRRRGDCSAGIALSPLEQSRRRSGHSRLRFVLSSHPCLAGSADPVAEAALKRPAGTHRQIGGYTFGAEDQRLRAYIQCTGRLEGFMEWQALFRSARPTPQAWTKSRIANIHQKNRCAPKTSRFPVRRLLESAESMYGIDLQGLLRLQCGLCPPRQAIRNRTSSSVRTCTP